jgi:hypothetical protein
MGRGMTTTLGADTLSHFFRYSAGSKLTKTRSLAAAAAAQGRSLAAAAAAQGRTHDDSVALWTATSWLAAWAIEPTTQGHQTPHMLMADVAAVGARLTIPKLLASHLPARAGVTKATLVSTGGFQLTRTLFRRLGRARQKGGSSLRLWTSLFRT